MDNLTFSINDNGNIIEYKIIKILTPANSQYQYIVYTDNDNDYYASRYELVNDNVILKPILEEYEWDYINKFMEEVDINE